MRAGIGVMMGSWEIMGVGASVMARAIRERAVLLMEGFPSGLFLASFRVVGFLNVFFPGGGLLLGLFEIEFLLDCDRGFLLVA